MQILPKRRHRNSDDNIIPLINIVFLLLIFFMVAGQIQRKPNADIDLPQLDVEMEKAPLREFAELMANGDLIYQSQLISPLKLAETLNKPTSLTLVVDRNATAKQLESILAPLRNQQDIHVSLLLEQVI